MRTCASYRTPTQLGLLERFHQTLKTEEVYWKLYAAEARASLAVFHQRYRGAPALGEVPPDGGDPVTPADVYVDGQAVGLKDGQKRRG